MKVHQEEEEEEEEEEKVVVQVEGQKKYRPLSAVKLLSQFLFLPLHGFGERFHF
jgi:hypothetical protein